MQVKAVVFDFGNVIINIDPERTYQAFSRECLKSAQKIKEIFHEIDLFRKYESGFFNDEEFREVVRQALAYPINDAEIDECWNALLLDVPAKRLAYIEKLRLKYPVFLLSNTNPIHFQKCKMDIRKSFGYSDFTKLFQKVFLSYEMKLFKPDFMIFDEVLKEIKFKAEQVLFIDDNAENIQTAADMGFQVVLIEPKQCFTDLLPNLLLDV